jgi:uncharacterized protein YqgV (UPF0045/DUF77 family)
MEIFDYLHENHIHYESTALRTYFEMKIKTVVTDDQLNLISKLCNEQFCRPVYVIYKARGKPEKTIEPPVKVST